MGLSLCLGEASSRQVLRSAQPPPMGLAHSLGPGQRVLARGGLEDDPSGQGPAGPHEDIQDRLTGEGVLDGPLGGSLLSPVS